MSGFADPRRLFDEQALDMPLTQESGAYFDEMYFVRTAWEHIHFKEPYEWTHPPLAKLIIAAGILLFGMIPFGWRIFGVIAATAMIPLVFILAKRIFRSSAGLSSLPSCSLLTSCTSHSQDLQQAKSSSCSSHS